MLEEISDSLVFLALIILVGLVLFQGLSCLIAGLFENSHLTVFVPPRSGDPPQLGPYASAMNEAAVAAGCESFGTYEHTKGGGYKVCGTLWLSPERDSMALVTGGTMFKMPFKSTEFYSRMVDGRWLATEDAETVTDHVGLVEHRVLYHADFPALLRHHRERLESSNVRIAPLSDADPWGDFHEMYAALAYRRVELGLCRFVDPAQTMTRYTWKGAWRMAVRSQVQLARAVGARKRRARIKRPGARGYVPSDARPANSTTPEARVPLGPRPKHSGLGIASCALAAAAYILAVSSIAIAVSRGEDAPRSPVVVFVFMSSLVCPLIGVVLAIVGLVQHDRKKLWSILGLIGSSFFLLLVGGCLLLV